MPLRGQEQASKKARRELENAEAIGGLRRPGISVTKVPGAAAVGERLRGVVDRYIDMYPHVLESVDDILDPNSANEKATELDSHILILRKALIKTLGGAPEEASERGI